MRVILTILASMMMFISATQAQQIRLGHRIPDINTASEFGTEIKLIEHEYVCLIFVHSESLPCINAIEHYREVSQPLSSRMATVLITPEERSDDTDIIVRYANDHTSVAFDDEHRTFKAFGVDFVPFGVIYDTKHRRVLWFGSILQLHHEMLDELLSQNIRGKI